MHKFFSKKSHSLLKYVMFYAIQQQNDTHFVSFNYISFPNDERREIHIGR